MRKKIDLRRLTFGERLTLLGAVVLFVALFIQWYRFFPGGRILQSGGKTHLVPQTQSPGGENAWQAFSVLDLFLLATVLVAVGLAIVVVTRRSMVLPIAASVLTAVLGTAATLAILYRIANLPGPDTLANPEVGAYLGLLSALVVAIGGWLTMREEGLHLHDARRQLHGLIDATHRIGHHHPRTPRRSEDPRK